MTILKSTTFMPSSENDRYNVKIENDIDGEIIITVNSWIDQHGGSDGEGIALTLDEFREFITECQNLLAYVSGE